MTENSGDEFTALLRGRALLFPRALPGGRWRIAWNPTTVLEQLLDGYSFVLFVHLALQVWKYLRNRRVPAQFALLDEHRRERGGHGLGAGADVENVIGRDRRGVAIFAHAHGGAVADFAIFHHDNGECGQFIFLEERLQGLHGSGRWRGISARSEGNIDQHDAQQEPADWMNVHSGGA
ncbi:MAG: hypothetical protein U1F83_12160 [Verrucomicrobiota bacterium]